MDCSWQKNMKSVTSLNLMQIIDYVVSHHSNPCFSDILGRSFFNGDIRLLYVRLLSGAHKRCAGSKDCMVSYEEGK